MFHKFSQIRKNKRRQSCQLLRHVPPKTGLSRQTHYLIHLRLKSQQNSKIISLNFGNTIYQTITTFQKSSGFLELEPVSSNSKRRIVRLMENSIRRH